MRDVTHARMASPRMLDCVEPCACTVHCKLVKPIFFVFAHSNFANVATVNMIWKTFPIRKLSIISLHIRTTISSLLINKTQLASQHSFRNSYQYLGISHCAWKI